nr:nucleolin-like isoform X2 [Ipomoea batatas]
MRTPNSETPKAASTAKKTPPSKKSAGKSQNTPDAEHASELTPMSNEAKRTPVTRAKQAKANETTANAAASVAAITPNLMDSKQSPAAEGSRALDGDSNACVDHAALETKPVSRTKIVRRVVRKVVRKNPKSGKNASVETSKSTAAGTANIEDSLKEKEEDSKFEVSLQDETGPEKEGKDLVNLVSSDDFCEPVKKDQGDVNVNKHAMMDIETAEAAGLTENVVFASDDQQTGYNDVEISEDHETVASIVKSSYVKESVLKDVKPLEHQEEAVVEDVESTRFTKPIVADTKSLKDHEFYNTIEGQQLNDKLEGGQNVVKDKIYVQGEVDRMEEDSNEKMKGKNIYEEESDDDRIEAFREQVDHEVLSGEEFAEGDTPHNGEEADAVADERAELNAAANERRKRKELEIFVGGLDRDATEEDLRRVFQHAGEVLEVRMHKELPTNKNKGYAFVRFATKEQASRVLAEMRNPVIRGKRCGTAPCEDNDTLFLGNICNTWTKEAIRQRLREYGIESVVSITLVEDPKHEGLSRGFAFIEFSCHADAMTAYKRLQKPDAVFGHSERTAKVAFAEPLSEPDPEVMAQVKSVFVDGLPPHWDEDRVRDNFKGFGETVRIILARNMSSAKRKDFGFVDFTTHEAAVACVEGINNTELNDGNSKIRVRARLSNPLPKTQAVKGGMSGGFRIGRGNSGAYKNYERGFARGGRAFGQPNFQRGRGFYPRGHGYGGRMGFSEHEFDRPYPPFPERQNFGGERWGFRGGHPPSDVDPAFARPYFDRPQYGDRSHMDDGLRRQPYLADEAFDRPFMGRHYEDPYFYDQTAHGMKRPFFRTDPDYMEPSRHRPRLDYSDPAVSLRRSRYRDDLAADGGFSSQDYYGYGYGYGSDFRGHTYQSFYHGDSPYGRGYY